MGERKQRDRGRSDSRTPLKDNRFGLQDEPSRLGLDSKGFDEIQRTKLRICSYCHEPFSITGATPESQSPREGVRLRRPHSSPTLEGVPGGTETTGRPKVQKKRHSLAGLEFSRSMDVSSTMFPLRTLCPRHSHRVKELESFVGQEWDVDRSSACGGSLHFEEDGNIGARMKSSSAGIDITIPRQSGKRKPWEGWLTSRPVQGSLMYRETAVSGISEHAVEGVLASCSLHTDAVVTEPSSAHADICLTKDMLYLGGWPLEQKIESGSSRISGSNLRHLWSHAFSHESPIAPSNEEL